MAGTVTVEGTTVTFDQPADTFVRDLVWTHSGSRLSVVDQAIGGVSYTITLEMQ